MRIRSYTHETSLMSTCSCSTEYHVRTKTKNINSENHWFEEWNINIQTNLSHTLYSSITMPNLLTINFQHVFIHHPPWQNKKFVKLEMKQGFGCQRWQISEQICLLHSSIFLSRLPGFVGYYEEP